MIRAAISFFALGLIAVVLGAYQVAGLSMEIGEILLGVFLLFALLSFVGAMVSGRKPAQLP